MIRFVHINPIAMLQVSKSLTFTLFLITIGVSGNLTAQVSGCTDPLSSNFNPLAVVNDGSCVYAAQSISPLSSVVLSDTLQETSGLIQWENRIWTHNDNTDTSLYGINPANGAIEEVSALPGVMNTDWEELSQDADYIYVGDFGNNSAGNRTDLHILRIAKSSINAIPAIDTIAFHYSNQQSFTGASPNTTNFDCEAFIVSADSIYLFSKRWGDKRTFLYALPKTPGNYTAMLQDSLNVQGLITGANYIENKRLVVLCGYTTLLQPFFYALYDFEGHRFFSGNKRKIGISLSYTQIEGITSTDGLHYYLSNERFVNGPANVSQQLHTFDLGNYLHPYLTANTSEIQDEMPQVYPNPAQGTIHCKFTPSMAGKPFTITDLSGKTVQAGIVDSEDTKFQLKDAGVYILEVGQVVKTRFVII